jgi:hypothetical protein
MLRYLCCLLLLAASVRAVEEDETLLKHSGIATDGPGLLTFLRQHTTTEADETALKKLVRNLGDERFRTRERASATLVAMGTRALPFLNEAVKDSDLEISRRAERCLTLIAQGSSDALIGAAIRLIAARKPAGSDRALLDFIGGTDRESLQETAIDGLTALALNEGKPNAVIVAALTDANAVRRTAAGVALTRANAKDALAAVRKLLADPKLAVRQRVGLALVTAKEKDALLPLIRLLGEMPASETGLIEDMLYRLAGDNPPDLPADDRKKIQTAWEDWLTKHKDKLDLDALSEAVKARHTLVVLLDQGKIVDLDENKKVLWQIENIVFPLDAQLLPNRRVLVAEYQGNRVTERDTKGEVHWEKKVNMPIAAQRLPNGNTFIATATQLIEVDKTGKEVWTKEPPRGGRIMKAQRLRNGDTAVITLVGGAVSRFIQIDKDGKEVRDFAVEQRTSGGRVEILPSGNVLLCERDANRIVEVNQQGKPVWQAKFDQPVAAVRLPNGNTLVTSMSQTRAVELDRQGKEVWEYRAETRITRAWRH